jgi:two-component system nitrate/nitrite response regulator NarL
MPEPIKILVVDDHPLFRGGLTGLLREHDEFCLVGEADNCAAALALSLQTRPDVVLMDVHMPACSGIDAVAALKQNLPVRILMLTISDRDEDLLQAITAGADGYLLKSIEPEELCRAIKQVVAGHSVLSPEITAAVMRAAVQGRSGQPEVALSPREQEVLAEMAKGATTAEIAACLVIAPSTVKTHVSHILEKMGAANRTEAVGRALALGLLDPILP